jgi:peptidyl-prolyl cis-trans isomerase A (cyclophilin A)
MKGIRRALVRAWVVVMMVAAATTPAGAGEEGALPALTEPGLAAETAPDRYRVKLETTKGDVVIEVIREWAPHGADRFYNLVKIGYYQDVAFYRVIDGFMAQVGMHGDPAVQSAWSGHPITDDPIVQNNSRGMVTFAATSAPDSRTTQFFINLVDNSYLRRYGKFASFGRVVEGMDVVDSLFSGYGEGAPRGDGPSQAEIARRGNAYLKQEFPKLDYITRASLVGE